MSTRRKFIQQTGILSGGLLLNRNAFASNHAPFNICMRPKIEDRNFVSPAVEQTILTLKKQIADPELACLFENCFPNTLDTTVDFEMIDGKPDTFVITGDIDAMWLRDSTAQVWPYLPLVKEDGKLKQLVEGVINRQKKCIILDRYTNAFYKDLTKKSEWSSDITEMKPGIHERKWEIDSLCYPIRLAYHYWKITGDTAPFDNQWEETIRLTLKTFKEQQRKDGDGPYSFQRNTSWATDGVPLSGYGYPVKPVGLICSIFRPSDDATLFPFLIPSNFFAVVSLEQAAEMLNKIRSNATLATECVNLAKEVNEALRLHGVFEHKEYGKIYPFEVNGFGSVHLMDDANVPSLLSLPYLNAVKKNDAVYANTRKYILSEDNPFFFKGKAAEGIGGPHAGMFMIWPLSITMRGLTSTDAKEVRNCLHLLKTTHAGTGFMHEAFHKDDASRFTRKWFAWANTLFGEFVLHTSKTFPAILSEKNI
jgi:meiotically up-regulated gene 157 (Mug157) protein